MNRTGKFVIVVLGLVVMVAAYAAVVANRPAEKLVSPTAPALSAVQKELNLQSARIEELEKQLSAAQADNRKLNVTLATVGERNRQREKEMNEQINLHFQRWKNNQSPLPLWQQPKVLGPTAFIAGIALTFAGLLIAVKFSKKKSS